MTVTLFQRFRRRPRSRCPLQRRGTGHRDFRGATLAWNTPRFVRMSLPGVGSNSAPSHALSRSNGVSQDDLSVNISEDSTLGAGLFVQRSANLMRSLNRSTVSGRFSSMVMMSRSEVGSNLFNAAVVTMQDRRLVTVPGGGTVGQFLGTADTDDLKHRLKPYVAAGPTNARPQDTELTYEGEVMGYITQASRPIVGGGGGEFVFRTSAFTPPDVEEGGWVCLMRQEYPIDPYVPGSPAPTPQPRIRRLSPCGRVPVFDSDPQASVRFGWYQISDVVDGPNLDSTGTYYETQLSVRGPDWVFHPSQVNINGLRMQPYFSSTVVPAGTAPGYDFATTGHPDFGTIVVCMPDVVSVRQFPIRLE